MSVSLREIINNAGYDPEGNPDDAAWLLSRVDEFGEIADDAEATIDRRDEIIDMFYDGQIPQRDGYLVHDMDFPPIETPSDVSVDEDGFCKGGLK